MNEKAILKIALAAVLTALLINPAWAASAGTVQGTVIDAANKPIAAAHIVFAAGATRFSAVSGADGSFTLDVPAQTYIVTALARGFAPLAPRTIPVSAGATATLVLQMARNTAGSIAVLDHVTVNGRQVLSTASAPSASLDPQDLAGRGIENLADALSEQIAVTMTRPAGGAPGLPQTASLRGPDPSETLIDIDGHVVNNANTGDFDLELLDPSEFSAVQVVYGVGPTSLDGANTQGGTINFHTIDPTPQDQGLLRFSLGTFNTSGYTLQATGTTGGRLGYALSFHRYSTDGAVSGYDALYEPNPQASPPTVASTALGSTIDATSSLLKLRYSLGTGDGFVEATYRNTTAYRDLSAPLSFPTNANNIGPSTIFTAYPGASDLTNSPAYGLDVQLPVGDAGSNGIAPGTLIVRHLTNVTDQTVPGVPVTLANPYLFDNRDVVSDDSAQYERALANGTWSVLTDVRHEDLTLPPGAPFSPGILSTQQTQRSYAGLYQWDSTPHLHYTAAVYVSRYDTFGSSIDPRLALVWTPNADNVFRTSLGTGFRAPLMTERAINPTLTAEHTSEFEVGYEHRFGDDPFAPRLELDAYSTALRDPIFFVPSSNPGGGQFGFIENLANVRYQGVEMRLDKQLSRYSALHAEYGIDIAYPLNDPAAFDPSAPNVVSGQQFQGIPPHKGLVSLDGHGSTGFGYTIGAGYESANNELNRPSYWLFNGSVYKQLQHTTLTLGVQNLTNQFADKFTLFQAGIPYPTPTGPSPTNAYSLPGRALTFTVTQRL
jgi:outer membrane receptor protein involved in Fe transport